MAETEEGAVPEDGDGDLDNFDDGEQGPAP